MLSTGHYLEIIRFGLAILVLAFGLFITLPPEISVPRMVAFQIVMALGLGILFQAPLVALQAHLKKKDIATGTATFGFIRMLSAGISIVLGDVLFQSQMRNRASSFISSGIPSKIEEMISNGSSTVGTFLLEDLTQVQKEIVRNAQNQSLSRMWIFYTAIACVGLIAGFGIKRKELSMVHDETKTGLEGEGSSDRSTSVSEGEEIEIGV